MDSSADGDSGAAVRGTFGALGEAAGIAGACVPQGRG